MSKPKVLVYGASGYTGKLIAEALAERGIPFYFAGRTASKLEAALEIVKQRRGGPVDAEIVVAENTKESLLKLFRDVEVVINVAGPFMQVAWPVVEAALEAGCHYLDTTGEQDWTIAIAEKYGAAFADKGRLMAPATSYMWAAGAMAAEVVLENPEVDSLDILYQSEDAVASFASTQSFLRMVCNESSQFYLKHKQYKLWPNDVAWDVHVPYRNAKLHAHPWGGGCEPVWFKNDPRVRNCKVMSVVPDEMVETIITAIKGVNSAAKDLSREQREAITNQMAGQMSAGEPPKDDLDVQRGAIVVCGQGRRVTTRYVMALSAGYGWTGQICAESAQRLLNGQLRRVGFQSAPQAFGYRELITTFHALGYCGALPD